MTKGTDQKTEIERVITPVITGAGYELADFEWRRDRGGFGLRPRVRGREQQRDEREREPSVRRPRRAIGTRA